MNYCMKTFKRLLKRSAIAIESLKIFQIEIGIAISISDGNRDRYRDLNFSNRGHALQEGM